jgi:hypothetical protein
MITLLHGGFTKIGVTGKVDILVGVEISVAKTI